MVLDLFMYLHIHVYTCIYMYIHVYTCICTEHGTVLPLNMNIVLHVIITLHVHVFTCTCTCIISHRDKANPSNDAQRQPFFFPREKEELPWVGLEPTMYMYMYMHSSVIRQLSATLSVWTKLTCTLYLPHTHLHVHVHVVLNHSVMYTDIQINNEIANFVHLLMEVPDIPGQLLLRHEVDLILEHHETTQSY